MQLSALPVDFAVCVISSGLPKEIPLSADEPEISISVNREQTIAVALQSSKKAGKGSIVRPLRHISLKKEVVGELR